MRSGAIFAALLVSSLSTRVSCQHALLRRSGDLHPVAAAGTDVRSVVERLLLGPTAGQRSAGITTALPAGVRLLELDRQGSVVTLTLSAEFLRVVTQRSVREDAVEQLVKTALRAGPFRAVHILVRDQAGAVRRLTDLLGDSAPPARLRAKAAGIAALGFGVLRGKTIAISPGHGYYWHSTVGWTTQRPRIDDLIEDIHTAEIANRYLIPALENMGARVISCRERGELPSESLSDNDLGASFYNSQGLWGTSNGGYLNRTFQSSGTATTATSTATWQLTVPSDGEYSLYAFFPVILGAAKQARYTVYHTGGPTLMELDQSRNHLRWTHLGNFYFTRAGGARIVLDNQSMNTSEVVVADAMRIGGGRGSISRGSGTSGKPRWEECSRYWTQFVGAPSSVYNTASGQDNNDDVTARPRYAEWRGADAFLSLHTNAGGGTGTSSFIYNGTPSAGSAALQTAVHNQLVGDIRARYDSAWTDRGRKRANFGEVRVLQTMPGVLVELAFHDTPNSKDHRALHDPRFRMVAGQGLARGIMRYFSASAPFPPGPPTGLRVVQSQNRGLTVAWEAVTGATHYTVERSGDGKGFVEVAQSNATSWSTAPLGHGTVSSFRVRAWNSSGRSFPTEVLTAGTSHTRRAELLMVQGFDRLGRYVKTPENTADYLRLHGAAIRAANEFSLGFDAASNEAVQLSRVRLRDYRVVNWASGEESTKDETFSDLEQSIVAGYLNGGGRMLLSGAEIGWDLWARGSAGDRSFYTGAFGARYLRDDALTYGFGPAPGTHIFTGLGSGAFDDGRFGTYDVDFADVIAGADSRSTICLTYSNGGGAAIQRVVGNSRLVYLGFPLETITNPGLRAQVMARALRFLLAGRALEAPPTMDIGTTAVLSIRSPGASNSGYLLAASGGLGTIPLPVDHIVPLFPDLVLDLSLQPNAIFVAFRGTLDSAGRGNGRFVVPNLPIARGVNIYFSGLTLQGGNVREVLPWVRIAIR